MANILMLNLMAMNEDSCILKYFIIKNENEEIPYIPYMTLYFRITTNSSFKCINIYTIKLLG